MRKRNLIFWAVTLIVVAYLQVPLQAQDWTYLGSTPTTIYDILMDDSDPQTIWLGTHSIGAQPGTGGIFRSVPGDTGFTFVALADRAVYQIATFTNYQGLMLAATHRGLYRSDNGGSSWELATTFGGGFLGFSAIDISPYDSNLWIGSTHGDGAGAIHVTTNAAVSWSDAIRQGSTSDLHWSRNVRDEAFWTYWDAGYRYHWPDPAPESIIQVETWDFMMDSFVHPVLSYIYFLSLDSLYQYDEVTEQLHGYPLPVGLDDPYAENLALDPSGRLLLCHSLGLYLASFDLNSWDLVAEPPEGAFYRRVYTTSTERYAIVTNNEHGQLYRQTVLGAADPRPHIPQLNLFVYPNPFNNTTTLIFLLTHPEDVTLRVFDLLGREQQAIALGSQLMGEHRQVIDLSRTAAGTYWVQIDAGKEKRVTKVQLIR